MNPQGSAANELSLAEELGLSPESLVQEFGYDEDVDFDLRDAIEERTGEEILTEEDHEVVDAVLVWWREGDGDLVDMLVDAQATLDEGGVVWLLTPKKGRDLHVSAADIAAAAPTAGLHVTRTAGVSEDWTATRLVGRRAN
ncbi:DUF3052 domain-containing protein [Falsarthrobacter nasiphocae]|uniref:DUF3052 domain-containing protein n=1 Tax=Falsarthrobacter nasiphocae TaxID=189863 RepID=A0AAE4C622_9MICC|nr:DUF3052 domain-containing protein [Falsarthrobacter nasiphocae]MDR6892881.1 hypothetical protein [Falsarthrobacter nasiphocae]